MSRIPLSRLCFPGIAFLSVLLMLTGEATSASISINSTSQNASSPNAVPVPEQPMTLNTSFQIVANNDLGMHCGDLDQRLISILPPFNVVHAQVIQKGSPPKILTNTDVDVFYSAASNPLDPWLSRSSSTPVYKTNFWDPNLKTGDSVGSDAYNAFYPPGILPAFPLTPDTGIPVPDVERLYLGDGQLTADQQKMPGATGPYSANTPQRFNRFNTDFPLFKNFSFGYTQTGVNWFAAEGVPITPVDDSGRENPFPLMRVQAVDKTGNLTGTKGKVLASVDTVIPVSGEVGCYRCHTSSKDGGKGKAACIPGIDAGCTAEGSPRSGTRFTVAFVSQDTSTDPFTVKRERASDKNILRLHDVKHGTNLEPTTPLVCQKCHYSPALDLAHVGPKGPRDPDSNGRDQLIHHTNSRALHRFHGKMKDLTAQMPPPNDPLRLDPATGKPTINQFVLKTLDHSCYLCHPGKNTKCLRGVMYNSGGLVCQDCHGNLSQVGDDFSRNFSTATPFPAGMVSSKRIPWASEPGCQSCHTGDANDNLASRPNVIPAKDGIRLLRAYKTNSASAKPIIAINRRFAENATQSAQQVLFRLSKDSHAGIYCEACHGGTHAEWSVKPDSGTQIGNDNVTAIQLQGHTGAVIECKACHTGTMPNNLQGPHGLHPVDSSNWIGGHGDFAEGRLSTCRACHGATGQGTVLSKVRATRVFQVEGRQATLVKGSLTPCNTCHQNPL
ncbi:MAG: cytochrome C [Syntrophobacter sp.]